MPSRPEPGPVVLATPQETSPCLGLSFPACPGRVQPERVGGQGMGGVPSPARQGAQSPGGRGQATPEPCLPLQLLANAVVFLCGNLTGAFHKHHMQGAALELFTYTVKCIQIRRKLRIEKRQQVGARPPAAPPPAPPLADSQAPGPASFSVGSRRSQSRMCGGHVAGHPCRLTPGAAGDTRGCVPGWVGGRTRASRGGGVTGRAERRDV